MIFDRGYDDNKIIDYVDKSKNNFVIRMNDKRMFFFKAKRRTVWKKQKSEKEKLGCY